MGSFQTAVSSSQAQTIDSRLAVVAETPVAQHLEKRMVVGVTPDLLQVVVLARDPDAFLAVHGAGVFARTRAQEHVLELVHPGVDKQQGRVSRGHHRGAGDNCMVRGF